MEDLTKTQLILLVLLVSFITSLSTVVVTISLLEQVPKPEPQAILQKVIQRVVQNDDTKNNLSQQNVVIVSEDDLVVGVVEQISPAVVSIVASKDLSAFDGIFGDPFGGGEDFFQEFFGVPLPPNGKQETEHREIGHSTGFIVSADGYIITNRHVVSDTDAEYAVILNSGKTEKAKVIATDPVQDIAIIKIDVSGLPFVKFGNSDAVKVGQKVIAIGNALGQFQNTVSVGIISGIGRTIVAFDNSGPSELHRVLQTDAAINPGNSGGPLITLAGEVIGINTAIVSGAENIGFAIPANGAKRDLEQVQRIGRIVYPFLGVRYILITEDIQKKRNLSVSHGVLVIGNTTQPAIVPDSPAARAGLRDGDIITEINDVPITKDQTLADYIQMRSVGDILQVTAFRDGKVLSFTVTLVERPNNDIR